MTANFLDISKAFDKVWHEGLLFKLECIGISGNFPSLLKSLLKLVSAIFIKLLFFSPNL